MTDHTVKAFDADLARLMEMVAEMGELVEKALKDSVEALVGHDNNRAERVITLNESNDAIHREIEASAISTIARRQPVAYDLRAIVAALRTADELERVGDLANNIAARAIALSDNYSLPPPAYGLRLIARTASRRLHEAVDSLVQCDAAKALSLCDYDKKSDAMYEALCRELLTYMMAEPKWSPSAVHLLFCAKNIELMGDHVTNIADAVHYLEQGEHRNRGSLQAENLQV